MFASGLLTALRYVSEGALGIPSGGAYKALRFTDVSINPKKATFESAEIRSDRQVADLRHGMPSVDGDISFELGLSTYDDLIAAAVSGAWDAPTTGAITVDATAGGNTLERTAGSFLADGFAAGDEVLLAGFATGANNGATKVVSISLDGQTMTVEKALTTEAAAAGVTVSLVGQKVSSGTTLSTFSIERAFLDVNQFLLFKGCAVDQMKLSVKPEAMVTGTFSVVGVNSDLDPATHSTSVVPAATNSPMDTFIGVLEEGGVPFAAVTSLDVTVANNRAARAVVGGTEAVAISEGMLQVSGTLTAYFKDEAMLAKFLDETESSLDVKLMDPNGVDFHRFRVPRLKYTGGTLDNPKDGLVGLSLPFTGLHDPQSKASFIYQRSNA